jgi:hypothetical protein
METLLILSSYTMVVSGLVLGAIIMLVPILLLLSYRVLAPRNIFFTFGRENRINHIMTGKKFSGKVIFPSKTIYVDTEDKYDIKKLDDLPLEERKKFIQPNLLGMYWIGFYPFKSIYERHQQWLEWKSTPTGREIQFRDEMTPHLVAKPFEYAMFLEEAEDKGGVPLNIYFTVILIPINAIIPIFGNDDAYGQVQTLCLGEALLFVKEKTFANLGGDNPASDIEKDEFSKAISSLNKKIPGRFEVDPNDPNQQIEIGLETALGYKILDAKLNTIEVVGTHKDEILKATTAKYVAVEGAKADIAKAEGEKQVTILKGEGNKIAGMLGYDVEKYSMDIRNAFYEQIKDKPYAQQIELAKKMFTDSNLTTFVSGKDVTPTINLGGGK